MTTRGLMAVAVAATVACGVRADGPPEIQEDRTSCSHCGMLVSEPVYAAAYRAPGSESRVFDDIRCLLDAAKKEPQAGSIRFWFHDADSGAWIDGRDAAFVTSDTLRTPMGGGLIAYRDPAAARAGAARHQGRVAGSLSDLLRTNDSGGTRAPGHVR